MLESLLSGRAGSKANLLTKRMDVLRIETRINQSEHKLTTSLAELKELDLQKNQINSDFREKAQEEFNRESAKVALLEAQINASKAQAVRSEIPLPGQWNSTPADYQHPWGGSKPWQRHGRNRAGKRSVDD